MESSVSKKSRNAYTVSTGLSRGMRLYSNPMIRALSLNTPTRVSWWYCRTLQLRQLDFGEEDHHDGSVDPWSTSPALDTGYGCGDTKSLFIVRLSWFSHPKASGELSHTVGNADRYCSVLQSILSRVVVVQTWRQWPHTSGLRDAMIRHMTLRISSIRHNDHLEVPRLHHPLVLCLVWRGQCLPSHHGSSCRMDPGTVLQLGPRRMLTSLFPIRLRDP